MYASSCRHVLACFQRSKVCYLGQACCFAVYSVFLFLRCADLAADRQLMWGARPQHRATAKEDVRNQYNISIIHDNLTRRSRLLQLGGYVSFQIHQHPKSSNLCRAFVFALKTNRDTTGTATPMHHRCIHSSRSISPSSNPNYHRDRIPFSWSRVFPEKVRHECRIKETTGSLAWAGATKYKQAGVLQNQGSGFKLHLRIKQAALVHKLTNSS